MQEFLVLSEQRTSHFRFCCFGLSVLTKSCGGGGGGGERRWSRARICDSRGGTLAFGCVGLTGKNRDRQIIWLRRRLRRVRHYTYTAAPTTIIGTHGFIIIITSIIIIVDRRHYYYYYDYYYHTAESAW